ncbi:MAG: tRNA pseudouridine(38-40) synthase TruA [Myxococcales bacterium]|nr:MAG: tRNA pseudouridine(38-40) synthase TruA [Myxococcales bacterium]
MMRERGWLLTLAYDGLKYSGWQKQQGLATVQGVLEEAIVKMAGHEVATFAASRTDAGVHALGQRVSFATRKEISEDGWFRGLNTSLPRDISVRHIQPCAPDYNPRFDSVEKRYRYVIDTDPGRNPLFRLLAWHRPWTEGLDLDAMQRAAESFLGEHDFKAFRSSADPREKTVRIIRDITVQTGFGADSGLICVEICGNAFLHNMVRIMVGTLVEIGTGRYNEHIVPTLLSNSAERALAGQTAPAHGLCLIDVKLGRQRKG